MGYNVDEATKAAEVDADAKAENKPAQINDKAAVATTKEEQEALLYKMRAYAKKDEPEITAQGIDFSKPIDEQSNQTAQDDPNKEMMRFPTDCFACTANGEVRMCIATIPYFKEIIIMAFSCDYCGHKSTEIKHGGGISEKATRIVFEFNNERDLCRDLFKSDTCSFVIPEVEMEL